LAHQGIQPLHIIQVIQQPLHLIRVEEQVKAGIQKHQKIQLPHIILVEQQRIQAFLIQLDQLPLRITQVKVPLLRLIRVQLQLLYIQLRLRLADLQPNQEVLLLLIQQVQCSILQQPPAKVQLQHLLHRETLLSQEVQLQYIRLAQRLTRVL